MFKFDFKRLFSRASVGTMGSQTTPTIQKPFPQNHFQYGRAETLNKTPESSSQNELYILLNYMMTHSGLFHTDWSNIFTIISGGTRECFPYFKRIHVERQNVLPWWPTVVN